MKNHSSCSLATYSNVDTHGFHFPVIPTFKLSSILQCLSAASVTKTELSQRCPCHNNKTTSFPFCSSVHRKSMDWFFENKSKKEEKHRKKTHHAAWQDTQPLSPLCEGSPTEVVARVLEHEALTALPKANFNLFQWNGIGDVWWISHCL